ncbi:MAG: hypothetical protein ACE5G0_16080 [Rhodothermales bacterium]
MLIPAEGLNAQPDPTVLLRMADQYCKFENYDACVTECLRFMHFAEDHPFVYYAYYRAGMAESHSGNLAESIQWFRAAANHAPTEDLRRRIKYRLAVTLLSQYQLDLAKIELFQLALTSRDTASITNSNILLGVIHTYLYEWDQARKAFRRAAQLHRQNEPLQEKMQAVEALLETLSRKPRIKSPRTAKWISTVLPGGGQIYAGRIWNGLNALALNTGTTYLVQRAIANGSPRNAILLITGLWWRYYKGNRFRAEEAAIRVNDAYREGILSEVYMLIQEASTYLPEKDLSLSLPVLTHIQ